MDLQFQHHMSWSFLCSMSSDKIRGGCFFCYYWWNSFHNRTKHVKTCNWTKWRTRTPMKPGGEHRYWFKIVDKTLIQWHFCYLVLSSNPLLTSSYKGETIHFHFGSSPAHSKNCYDVKFLNIFYAVICFDNVDRLWCLKLFFKQFLILISIYLNVLKEI